MQRKCDGYARKISEQKEIMHRQTGIVLAAIRWPALAKAAGDVPATIEGVAGLLELPNPARFSPGVYFLVFESEVVYVGQSMRPVGRIMDHLKEKQKIFDRCYLLPVAESDLVRVEAAFIRELRPIYNTQLLVPLVDVQETIGEYTAQSEPALQCDRGFLASAV